MLKDAALLQLGLTKQSLAESLMLKDATPYNVQWRGSQPVFVDIGSFERAATVSRGPHIGSSACSSSIH